MNLSNKSPLRYPGGKTRACKKLDAILNEYFNIDEVDTIISPFFGDNNRPHIIFIYIGFRA